MPGAWITLQRGKVFKDNAKIAEILNSFFGGIVNTLNIEKDKRNFCDRGNETDPLLHAVKKHSKHSSILRIKQYFSKMESKGKLRTWILKRLYHKMISQSRY